MRFRFRTLLIVLALAVVAIGVLWIRQTTPAGQVVLEALKGKTQGEVTKLLGPPQERDANRWLYRAGNSGIDDLWLEIDFRDGKVLSARRYPD